MKNPVTGLRDLLAHILAQPLRYRVSALAALALAVNVISLLLTGVLSLLLLALDALAAPVPFGMTQRDLIAPVVFAVSMICIAAITINANRNPTARPGHPDVRSTRRRTGSR